jgi:hypothetical protein
VREGVGIFGLVAGAIILALVGRYGIAVSDDPIDGAITAFLFVVIAIGAIGGPAVALHLFRTSSGWSRLWGVAAAVIAVTALVANLSNSLGAISGRADKRFSERAHIVQARKDDRGELERLVRERATVPVFAVTAEAAIEAAHAAVSAAEASRLAECDRRGQRCRDREGDEAARRTELVAVLRDKATSDRAGKLDAAIASLSAKLGTAPPVNRIDPLADTLGQLLQLAPETAATGQQIITVVVAELLIAFALIFYELRSQSPPPIPAPVVATQHATEPKRASPQTRTKPKHQLPEVPVGDVAKFAVANLRPAAGSSIPIGALYDPYAKWCESRSFQPVSRSRFEALFAELCDQSGFTRSSEGGTVRCLDLEIAA